MALIVACVYVPWEANSYDGKTTIPAGYSFMWDAPIYFYFTPIEVKTIGKQSFSPFEKTGNEMDKMLDQTKQVRLVVKGVDIKRLFSEVIALTAATGAVYLLAGIKRDTPSQS